MRYLLLVALYAVIGLFGLSIARAAVLFQESFEHGAAGWTATDQAVVSDISRRPGGKSLVIKQWKDSEWDSAWLSPAMANPGKPIKFSFWAVGNYLTCTDFSYSGCMDVVNYAKDGKNLGGSVYMLNIPWDDARKDSMWGKLLPSGLVWNYYEGVYTPNGDTFRLLFHWPKPLARGDCYLTDVRVAEATPAELSATSTKTVAATDTTAQAPVTNLALEMSTPVSANLFYQQDPLLFDALLYAKDGKALSLPADAKLAYAITDFQHAPILAGEAMLANAKPITDTLFLRKFPQRKANTHVQFTVTDERARATGREFFLEVKVVSQGKTLALDTVPYGVVQPRKIDPADYDKCRFTTTFFSGDQSPAARKEAVAEKTGASWSEIYDYSWKSAQPHYPGPITFKDKLPAFPRVTYCPNLEQVRGRPDDHPWGAIATLCPKEALLPDPFHPGVKTFDIDGYVAYMVAYIRQNRAGIARVVPSGLERPIDDRTIELHKKAYTAIKKEFPDLPVGFMLYGISMNPSVDLDQFMKEKLYDYCDFVDTHIYASAVDWTEWGRMQRLYKAMGRTPLRFISTEFCRVGGMDQVQRSRDMIAAHLDCFAHGLDNLLYFNCVNGGPVPQPFLREPTDLGSDQTSGFMYLQRVNRPKVADTADGAGARLLDDSSTVPVLQAMTYYNLVQNFEAAAWRKTLAPDANSIAYLFDRPDTTIAALWMTNPVGTETVAVHTQVAFTVQDLFGRAERIQPHDGIALLTLDYNPQTLLFDRKVDDLQITPISGGLTAETIARGSSGNLTLRLPPVWKERTHCRLALAVDGDWPSIKAVNVTATPGKESVKTVSLSCDLHQRVGAYTLNGRIYVGKDLVGLLKTNLQIDELLKAEVEGVPLTQTTAPAIKVTLSNLQKTPAKGEVTFLDQRFAPGFAAELRRQPYVVPARGTASVLIPLDRNQVNLSTSYNLSIDVHDASGIAFTKSEEVAFRACERAPGKITIDGDLSDWQLDKRTPIPFEREFTGYGKPWGGPDDQSGVFYTMWDDDYIYFAAVIRDNSIVSRSMDINLWMDDNIMFGFYPWGWKQGENLHSGYYREHLGLCKDGVGRIFRVGNVDGGPANADSAKIVVKKTTDGLLYEWAYPKAAIFPQQLKAGARFRLSMLAFDCDQLPNGQYTNLSGIQIGGFNSNVDARPVKWREFVLTE